MDLEAIRRYARQIALPDVGTQGQDRLLKAEVALVGDGAALGAASLYLAGAGVGRLRVVSLIVRAGFDDDPMLRAAVRLGIPVVVMRASAGAVDLVSFRHQGPCPHADLEVPTRPQSDSGQGGDGGDDGAGAVLAG